MRGSPGLPGLLLPLLGCCCSLPGAAGWRTWDQLPNAPAFVHFVGKFCFDYKPSENEQAGRFDFTLWGRVRSGPLADLGVESTKGAPCWGPCDPSGNLYLVVFDDEEDHWKQALDHWHTMGCRQMLEYASWAQNISEFDGQFNRTVSVHEETRPRFWYFAFAACGVDIVEPVTYEVHAENMLQGPLQSEFGLDEKGAPWLQLAAAVLFVGLALVLRQVARTATGAEALRSRPLLRMLVLSAMCSAAGAVCLSLHFLVFMNNGYGLAPLEVLGQLWVSSAKALLTLLQLLTAKGWALFYAPEELVQRRLMIAILAGIVFTSVACEVHAQYFHDWSTAVYLYESWPGMIILLLNLILFAEAWRSMRETYQHETSEEVRVFYIMISSASFLYFLTLPLMCILAAFVRPWVRAKYVSRTEVASRFIATVILSLCLKPSRLDAMVNARLEDGLETVGEPQDDSPAEDDDYNYDDEEELRKPVLKCQLEEDRQEREAGFRQGGVGGPAE